MDANFLLHFPNALLLLTRLLWKEHRQLRMTRTMITMKINPFLMVFFMKFESEMVVSNDCVQCLIWINLKLEEKNKKKMNFRRHRSMDGFMGHHATSTSRVRGGVHVLTSFHINITPHAWCSYPLALSGDHYCPLIHRWLPILSLIHFPFTLFYVISL